MVESNVSRRAMGELVKANSLRATTSHPTPDQLLKSRAEPKNRLRRRYRIPAR
jgi:hypothetical protein